MVDTVLPDHQYRRHIQQISCLIKTILPAQLTGWKILSGKLTWWHNPAWKISPGQLTRKSSSVWWACWWQNLTHPNMISWLIDTFLLDQLICCMISFWSKLYCMISWSLTRSLPDQFSNQHNPAYLADWLVDKILNFPWPVDSDSLDQLNGWPNTLISDHLTEWHNPACQQNGQPNLAWPDWSTQNLFIICLFYTIPPPPPRSSLSGLDMQNWREEEWGKQDDLRGYCAVYSLSNV